jgi:hypothetical protein
MKIKDLIDYLNQFDPEYDVTLGPRERTSLSDYILSDYIDLAVIIPAGTATPSQELDLRKIMQ